MSKNGVRRGPVGLFVRVGHRVEPPGLITGCRVIGRYIAANPQFGAAVTDDDFVFEDPGRTGDGIGQGLVNRDLAPHHLPGAGVQRLQTSIEHADIDLAVVYSDTAIDHITAALGRGLPGHTRVIDPELLATACVQRVDHRPGATDIHSSVDNDGGCLNPAGLFHFIDPPDAQVGQCVAVNFGQG